MKQLLTIVTACALASGGCKHHEQPAPTPPPIASAATAAAPPSILPFEGEITMTVTGEGTTKLPPSVTFDVKGDKVRESSANSPVRAIAGGVADHEYAINDARKTYATFDARPPAKEATRTPDATVSRSSLSEKVAGIVCKLWSIDEGSEKVDVCAAEGIPFFDLAAGPKPGNIEPRWAALLTREKAFPLRVVVHDAAGKERYRAQATKVEARKLDDSLFQLPAGFKPADLSADLRTASLP